MADDLLAPSKNPAINAMRGKNRATGRGSATNAKKTAAALRGKPIRRNFVSAKRGRGGAGGGGG